MQSLQHHIPVLRNIDVHMFKTHVQRDIIYSISRFMGDASVFGG